MLDTQKAIPSFDDEKLNAFVKFMTELTIKNNIDPADDDFITKTTSLFNDQKEINKLLFFASSLDQGNQKKPTQNYSSDSKKNKNKNIEKENKKQKKQKIKSQRLTKQYAKEDLLRPQAPLLTVAVDHNVKVPILDKISNYFSGHKPPLTTYTTGHSMGSTVQNSISYATHMAEGVASDLNNLGDLAKKTVWWRGITVLFESFSDWGVAMLLIIWLVIGQQGYTIVKTDPETGEEYKEVHPFMKYLGEITVIVMMIKAYSTIFKNNVNNNELGIWIRVATTLQNTLALYLQPEGMVPDGEGGFVNMPHMRADSVYGEDPPAVPQAAGENISVLGDGILLLMNTIIGVKTKKPFLAAILDYTKTSSIQRDNVSDMILKTSSGIFSLCKKMAAPDCITKFFEVDVLDPLQVAPLMKMIEEFIAESNAGLDMIDPTRPARYIDLETKVKAVIKELDIKSYDYRTLTQGLNELRKRAITVDGFNKSLSGDRVEPVGILLMGAPGVKKSVLLERMSKHIIYGTIPEQWKTEFLDNPTSFIYTHPTDKYHDGYNYKHWLTVMDDAYQIREGVGSENADSLATIKYINVSPYMLQMAKAELKNNTYFRSAFVAASTNLGKDGFRALEAIHDYSAVMRRYPIAIEVTINPKYQNGVGGADLLPRQNFEYGEDNENEISGTIIPDDYWILQRHTFDMRTKKFIPQGHVTYDDLVMNCIQKYKDNVVTYYMNKQSNMNSFNNLKDKIDQRFNSKVHNMGSWFAAKDPLEEKFKEKLKNVSQRNENLKPQSSYNDLDMIEVLPPEYSDSDNSDVEDHQSYKSFEADDYTTYRFKFIKRLRISCGCDPGELEDLADTYIRELDNNRHIYNGFVDEYLESYSIPDDKYDYYNTNFSNENGRMLPTKKLEGNSRGADIYQHWRINKHPIKSEWFYDNPDIEEEDSPIKYKSARSIYDSLNLKRGDFHGFYLRIWLTVQMRYQATVTMDTPFHFNEFFGSLDDLEKRELALSLTNPRKVTHFFDRICQTRFEVGRDTVTNRVVWPKWNNSKSITVFIVKRLHDCVNIVKKFLKKWGLLIMLLFSIGGAVIYGIYCFVKKLWNLLVPQSVDHSKMTSRSKKQSYKTSRAEMKVYKLASHGKDLMNPQGQFCFDGATGIAPSLTYQDFGAKGGVGDIMATVMNKHFYIIYLTIKRGDYYNVERFGQCVNLKGRYFWHPFHFNAIINNLITSEDYEGITVSLVNIVKTQSYAISAEDFMQNFRSSEYGLECDQSLLFMKSAQISSSGVYKYLMTEGDWDIMRKTSAADISILSSSITKKDAINTLVIKQRDCVASFDEKKAITATWEKEPDMVYRLPRNIYYRTLLSDGDCGALIFNRTGNFQNRVIAGMHVAGDSSCGLATVFSRELADELMSTHDNSEFGIFEEEAPNIYVENEIIEPKDKLFTSGDFKSEYKWLGPQSTDIVRSKICGKLPPPYNMITKAPAKLKIYTDSSGEPAHPMDNALKNYGFPTPCVEEKIISDAAESYGELLEKSASHYKYPREVWSIKQAIHGHNNVKSIAISTSSGFPMNLTTHIDMKKCYLKSYLLETNEEKAEQYYKIIESMVNDILDNYAQRRRPNYIYIDFLKDELRELEKVMNGSSRMISGAPFMLIVIFRMYFGAFMDFFFEANIDIGSAIGVNPYSEEWDLIGRRLCKFGKVDGIHKVLAGDYAKFDGRQNTVTLNSVLELINRFYGNLDLEANEYRTFIWSEITNSKHHCLNKFMEWFVSMASGNPGTAIINTMSNNLNIRMSWGHAGYEIACFNLHVYFIALGDDHALTVHPDFHEKFNQYTMPDLMLKIGHIYTTETKSEATARFRDLSEIEFLKRRWSYCNRYGRFIAPLRLESIISMLNWTKNKVDKHQISVDNITVALREFALYDKKTYDYWYGHLSLLKSKYYGQYTYSLVPKADYQEALRSTLDHEFRW